MDARQYFFTTCISLILLQTAKKRTSAIYLRRLIRGRAVAFTRETTACIIRLVPKNHLLLPMCVCNFQVTGLGSFICYILKLENFFFHGYCCILLVQVKNNNNKQVHNTMFFFLRRENKHQ